MKFARSPCTDPPFQKMKTPSEVLHKKDVSGLVVELHARICARIFTSAEKTSESVRVLLGGSVLLVDNIGRLEVRRFPGWSPT